MIRSSHHTPVYREVVAQAFRAAWHDRIYWVLALFAGFLMTAGSYDVMWKAMTSITGQSDIFAISTGSAIVRRIASMELSNLDRILELIGGIEMLMLLAIIGVAFGALSCVAQGAIVFAIGARKRGQKPTLSEAFRIGAKAFWPIAALNVLALAVIWVLRFLVAFPLSLALEQTTTATYAIYIVSFVVFVPLALMASILLVFALNAIMLQGAEIGDALRRGYDLIRKHWVVVIETVLLQVALSLGLWLAFIISILFVSIPIFVLILASAFLSSVGLFTFALTIGAIVFICALLAMCAFTVQFQYATWTYLYRRMGEGGVVPKIHRLVQNATGFFHVQG